VGISRIDGSGCLRRGRPEGIAPVGRLLAASARRIHATHRVPYRERLEAVRIIAERVVPLA
jgi:hypothetical protein